MHGQGHRAPAEASVEAREDVCPTISGSASLRLRTSRSAGGFMRSAKSSRGINV
jgi:hypothetical protein